MALSTEASSATARRPGRPWTRAESRGTAAAGLSEDGRAGEGPRLETLRRGDDGDDAQAEGRGGGSAGAKVVAKGQRGGEGRGVMPRLPCQARGGGDEAGDGQGERERGGAYLSLEGPDLGESRRISSAAVARHCSEGDRWAAPPRRREVPAPARPAREVRRRAGTRHGSGRREDNGALEPGGRGRCTSEDDESAPEKHTGGSTAPSVHSRSAVRHGKRPPLSIDSAPVSLSGPSPLCPLWGSDPTVKGPNPVGSCSRRRRNGGLWIPVSVSSGRGTLQDYRSDF